MGDPTRRLVFDRLRDEPGSVAAPTAGLPVSRPAVSQHLKILQEAGLVTDEAIGARQVYRLDRDGLMDLQTWLDGVCDQAHAHQAQTQRPLDELKSA